MFGIHDIWIILAYVLCILSAILCVVYGIVNWNKGADLEPNELAEESDWSKNESEIEYKL
ncbi:MAG TPA: hypothetical protein PKJ43_01145 [Prolixibacteraceae bacterium]|nr:hypothetical protein [Prolixibacteraceae bacterium]